MPLRALVTSFARPGCLLVHIALVSNRWYSCSSRHYTRGIGLQGRVWRGQSRFSSRSTILDAARLQAVPCSCIRRALPQWPALLRRAAVRGGRSVGSLGRKARPVQVHSEADEAQQEQVEHYMPPHHASAGTAAASLRSQHDSTRPSMSLGRAAFRGRVVSRPGLTPQHTCLPTSTRQMSPAHLLLICA